MIESFFLKIIGGFMADDIILYLSVLLGISESLALIPQLKSNSILTLVGNILGKLLGKK